MARCQVEMARCQVWLLLLWCGCSQSAPQPQTVYVEQIAPNNEEVLFMEKFGYLEAREKGSEATYTSQSISEAVVKLQAFAGLPQTGVLDQDTKKLFKMRRCGVKDLNPKSREKRYVIQQGWNKKTITYKLLNGASTLKKERAEELIRSALSVWAPHGGLTFLETAGVADIQMTFVRGDHGDGSPFDGPGSVVAHAFPPPYGTMHFDDDELWGDSPDSDDDVTDFFAVVVHEIGHALGLSHSDVKDSVMYPYYQVPVEKLHMDDILGMQALYFNEQSNSTERETESPVLSHSSQLPRFTKAEEAEEADSEELDDYEDIPDLCFANYDAIQVIQGYIYVFQEEWVWKLREKRMVEPGYPMKIHEVFIGLPKHVNTIRTIYEKRNGNIAIFYNKSFFEFNSSFHFLRRRNIGVYNLPRYVRELGIVFLSNYNNKTYLIDSDYERFWRYDESTMKMDKGYPKSMTAWRDLPYPVYSALIWKGDTFFFHGPRYWRFDNELVRVHEFYPLPTAPIWFPCDTDEETHLYFKNEQS